MSILGTIPLVALAVCASVVLGAAFLIRRLLRERRLLQQGVAGERQKRVTAEGRFDRLAVALDGWVWETDAEQRFTWMSDKVRDITGVEPEWHYGKTRRELSEDNIDSSNVEWEAHLATMDAYLPFHGFEFQRAGPDGVKWISTTGVPKFDESGNFQGYIGTGRDVTKEVEAGMEAFSRHELLMAALNSMSALFALWDADDRLVLCNEGFREINGQIGEALEEGITFEEHLRLVQKAGLFPASAGCEEEWLAARLAQHRNPGTTFEIPRQDGCWLLLQEFRTMNGGVMTLATDITEQKNTQQTLEERERQLRAVIENLPGAIFCRRMRPDGKTSYDFFCDGGSILGDIMPESYANGCDEDSILTGANFDFTQFLASMDEEDRDRYLESVGRSRAGLERGTVEFRVRNNAGVTRWIRNYATPQREANGDVIWYGIALDISQEKMEMEKRERFISAIDSLSEGIAVFDREDRLEICNRRYREIGLFAEEAVTPGTRFEELLRSYLHCSPPETQPADPEAWLTERMEQHRNPGKPMEVLRAGRWYQVQENVLPEGGIVNASLDITELVKSREHVRQAEKVEELGNLTGGVAHDFNNILAIIQGNVSFFERRMGDNEQLKAIAERTQKAVARGASLTQRLLAFSRQQVLRVMPIEVRDLFGSLEEVLQASLGDEVFIAIDQDADIWPCLADAGQLEQAILNLATNAQEAMDEGGLLTIHAANAKLVETDRVGEAEFVPGDFVRISVVDTGGGIPQEIRDHVYDPFFTTKQVGEGSGLGLSMVFGFVKQCKGHIAFETSADGTAFHLYFPRAQVARNDDIPFVEAVPVEEPASPPVPHGDGTILLVEDDEDLRQITAMILGEYGYRVLSASSGAEAEEILAHEQTVDLLLTDVILAGGMYGTALAEIARAQIADLKIVFMSGYSGEALKQRGRLGSDDLLIQKPFDHDDLATRLHAVLAA